MKDFGFICKVGVDAKASRIMLTRLLNRQLADTIDLRLQVRQAYFNVRGNYSQELQHLLNGLARDLRRTAEIIALRIRDLEGTVAATVRSVSHDSQLCEYPLDALDCRDHLQALLSSYSRYELDLRHGIEASEFIGDSESVVLLRTLKEPVERSLWFLEAFLEGIATGVDCERLPEWTPAFARSTPAEFHQQR